MKNNKGITLASLTVYIIAMVVILVILTFISANFTSQILDANERGKLANESMKFYSYLIADAKSAKKVLEYSNDYIRFDNDVKYTIRYLNKLSEGERENRQYEIYRNDVLISENLLDVNFDYDYLDNVLSFELKYNYNKILVVKNQSIKVGRGY